MKRIFGVIAVLVLGVSIFTSCKKDDTTAPSLTLNGAAVYYVNLGDTWTDPGFVATDDEDGDVTAAVIVTGTVDNKIVNKYTITYYVEDEAGNSTEAERTVYVKAAKLAGNYDVVDVVTGANAGTYAYTAQVDTSSAGTEWWQTLLIKNFGGYGNPVLVRCVISGSNIAVPAQNPPGMPAGFEGTITGTGTYNGNTKSLTTFNYTVVYTAGGTDTGSATLTKL